MRKFIIIGLLSIVLISGCVEDTSGTYDARYINTDLHFHSNLDIAQNVSVYPNEETLREVLFGYQVVTLQLAYYDIDDNIEEIPLYKKSLVSFAIKYTWITYDRWGGYDMNGKITTVALNSTEQLVNATMQDPAILIMPSSSCEEIRIDVHDNIIRLCAVDTKLRQGKYAKYSDFDLALDKVILVLIEEDL